MFYSIMMLFCIICRIVYGDTLYMVAAAIWGVGSVFANGFNIRR